MRILVLAVLVVLALPVLAAPPGAPSDRTVVVPAGGFPMGSDGEVSPDEAPIHRVELPAFAIDACEVTNGEYAKFLAAKGYEKKAYWSEDGWAWLEKNREAIGGAPRDWASLRESLGGDFDRYPVVGVSYWEAEAYAKFAGKRLPTEEEWEKAARGAEGRIFPWGNDPEAGGPAGGANGRTRPVGTSTKDRTPDGISDLGGNVSEWTSSWYRAYPGSDHESRHYGEKYRVIRGGSWRFDVTTKRRAAWRGYFRYGAPGTRASFLGIRLVGEARGDAGR